jgi:hypothetical protein
VCKEIHFYFHAVTTVGTKSLKYRAVTWKITMGWDSFLTYLVCGIFFLQVLFEYFPPDECLAIFCRLDQNFCRSLCKVSLITIRYSPKLNKIYRQILVNFPISNAMNIIQLLSSCCWQTTRRDVTSLPILATFRHEHASSFPEGNFMSSVFSIVLVTL